LFDGQFCPGKFHPGLVRCGDLLPHPLTRSHLLNVASNVTDGPSDQLENGLHFRWVNSLVVHKTMEQSQVFLPCRCSSLGVEGFELVLEGLKGLHGGRFSLGVEG
jgi:hypothetical protein